MSEKAIYVAVLGASENPERYSFKAFKMLKEYGYIPIPVNPTLKILDGVEVYKSLLDIQAPIDTLTVYVNCKISSDIKSEILKLNPKRVIFNPGSENSELQKSLESHGIHTVEACTLVLLRTKQFEIA